MLVADLTEDISVGQAGEEPTLSSSEKSVELEATEANRFSESQSATRTKSGVPGPTNRSPSNAQLNLFSSLSQYHSIYIEIMSILISVEVCESHRLGSDRPREHIYFS